MRETAAQYRARTGRAYAPPEAITRIARALAPDEALPTLFRMPGGCGLVEHFLDPDGALATTEELWAADRPLNPEAPGAAHFGTLAILQPLAFDFARERDGIFVGVRRAPPPGTVVWVPPSKLATPIPWDSIATAADAAPHLAGADAERAGVLASLERYVRELEEVAKAGLDDARVRWCDRPEEVRRNALAAAGLTPHWTGTTPTRTPTFA